MYRHFCDLRSGSRSYLRSNTVDGAVPSVCVVEFLFRGDLKDISQNIMLKSKKGLVFLGLVLGLGSAWARRRSVFKNKR